tara:strand:+ start:1266 stop:1493 length:228 start_codon:yes stop_codon:yes gene_type:complete
MTKKELETMVVEQQDVIHSLQQGIAQFITDVDTMFKQKPAVSNADIGHNLSLMISELEQTSAQQTGRFDTLETYD